MAVIKKYNDDSAGHQAALITYYGFLSIFPLLIVATTVVDLIAQHHLDFRTSLVNNINSFFPIGGQQLQASISSGHSKTGVALAVGLVVALYGARGIANAVRNMLDHAWAVPRRKRTGFPKSLLKSLVILLGSTLGLVITGGLTSYATSTLGHAWYYRTVPIILNVCLLYLLFMYIFTIGTSKHMKREDLHLGAAISAVGLLLLQFAGVTLVKHYLRNLQGLYGQFGLVLSILFWVYLQAQVVVYAVTTNVVHAKHLWPVSLTGK